MWYTGYTHRTKLELKRVILLFLIDAIVCALLCEFVHTLLSYFCRGILFDIFHGIWTVTKTIDLDHMSTLKQSCSQ